MKDEIFKQDFPKIFSFDERVASVFDDMATRSIPFYHEVMALCVALVRRFLRDDCENFVLDLGSATGNFLIHLAQNLQNSPIRAKLIGIDNAEAMTERARQKTAAYGFEIDFLTQDFTVPNFFTRRHHVITAHYTLQFIAPELRQTIVSQIFNSLFDGGIFIMSEKICFHNQDLHDAATQIYEDFKRAQGYSENEISRKRAALQNVLIARTMQENLMMLRNAGFEASVIFSHMNFATFFSVIPTKPF